MFGSASSISHNFYVMWLISHRLWCCLIYWESRWVKCSLILCDQYVLYLVVTIKCSDIVWWNVTVSYNYHVRYILRFVMFIMESAGLPFYLWSYFYLFFCSPLHVQYFPSFKDLLRDCHNIAACTFLLSFLYWDLIHSQKLLVYIFIKSIFSYSVSVS